MQQYNYIFLSRAVELASTLSWGRPDVCPPVSRMVFPLKTRLFFVRSLWAKAVSHIR